MLKEPSASWMRAGIYYWMGYAGPYLAAGFVRLAVVSKEADRTDAVRATSNAWAIGLVAALCFALALLSLKSLRPCRSESVFGAAALGLVSAVLMIALGMEWSAYTIGADRILLAALISAVILHSLTPRAARRLPGTRRERPRALSISLIHACRMFLATFALLSIFWFLGFSTADGEAVLMRFTALPVLIIVSLMYGFITATAFGAGAAIARYARGEPTLRNWYCSIAAGGTVLLLLVESALKDRFGLYLNEPSWMMLAPLLFGLGSALLPRPRPAA